MVFTLWLCEYVEECLWLCPSVWFALQSLLLSHRSSAHEYSCLVWLYSNPRNEWDDKKPPAHYSQWCTSSRDSAALLEASWRAMKADVLQSAHSKQTVNVFERWGAGVQWVFCVSMNTDWAETWLSWEETERGPLSRNCISTSLTIMQLNRRPLEDI